MVQVKSRYLLCSKYLNVIQIFVGIEVDVQLCNVNNKACEKTTTYNYKGIYSSWKENTDNYMYIEIPSCSVSCFSKKMVRDLAIGKVYYCLYRIVFFPGN